MMLRLSYALNRGVFAAIRQGSPFSLMKYCCIRGGARASLFSMVAVLGLCVPFAAGQSSNGVLREVYLDIGGGAVSDLTSNPNFPGNPSLETIQPTFEAPTEFAENYGQRMRALLLPPITGNYTFWIASDDGGALYLSTNEDPATKTQIATVNAWTSSREWTKEPNQQSATNLLLAAGQRYYIEALQKEGGGGDNLAVRWRLPNGVIEEPIPNNRLLVYGLGPPVISQQPTNFTTVEAGSASFTVRLQRMIGATFQWKRNGTNIPDATNFTYTLAPVSLADSASTFFCSITNALGGTNSATATLTVVPDATRPTISTVGNAGDLLVSFVSFSEAVEESSATNAGNYSISGGVVVTRAAFGVDNRTIILTTTPMAANSSYTLTVNNVRDRATTPNVILPGSQGSFSTTVRPIDIGYLSLPREPLGPSSRRHGVVISEVMYHPTNRIDGRNLEFIEIYNSQPWFEEIGGWRISGAIDFTFPSNTILQSKAFLVVAANPADFRATYGFTNVFGPFANSNGLQNSSGTLRLRNRSDAILFEMSYSGDPPYPAAADGAGHSLVLARPSYGERDPRAWEASNAAGGNPGSPDAFSLVSQRTIVINEFLAHTDLPDVDYIELFNYGNVQINVVGCILTDDPETNKFTITTNLANTVIPPRGFMVLTEAQLGFALSSGGETIYLKHPSGLRIIDAVRFEAQENGVATGRYPDGAPNFSRLAAPTPGTNNAPFKPAGVVIDEIMFDPISNDPDDEYIELYNRSTNTVNLSGWRIRDAVSFNLPDGTTIPSGGYLVIARNAARLRTQYQGLTPASCLGNYTGSLGNGGERIELNFPDEAVSTNASGQLKTNTIHIMLNELTYGPGGRWGQWSGGGGSSLELRDARSDNRLAPNWADSDESAKSQWVTVETTGVMDNGWADAYQLHITLLGAGEALVDNVEVIPSGGGNVIANGTFESGTAGWVFQGNHNETSWETAEGFASARSLHLRATGRGDSGANRVRTQLPSTLAPGTTVTLRAKVRWLKGNPNILLRLRGNWLEAPGYTLTARNLGTPGAPNSCAVANAGPAITEVRHEPALPAAFQQVLVVARVNDPDGIAFVAMNYRIDPSTNYLTLAMTNNGAGVFSTVIPAQASGVTAAFFIRASDNFAPSAASAFPSDAPFRECVVRWGDTTIPGTLPTYRFWLSQTNVTRWSVEEKMSNKPKDMTFIYGTNRVIYNAGGWFHGSPYHSPGYDSPVGASCDYDLGFPKDDPLLGETDINLFRPGNGGGDPQAQREIHAYWMGDQLGVPFLYHRPVFVFVNGQRRETVFHDAQQPNGDFIDQWYPDDADGDLHKIMLGFEFGDLAYGASEPGYAVVGADLSRYTTAGGVKKQARYRATWPRRSSVPQEISDYTNIFNLVETTLTNAPIGSDAYTLALSSVVDVEEWYRVHVAEHLFWNPDSYSYGGGQNAFAYKPERDTWKFFLWDVDFAFNGAPNDSNLTGIGGAEHGPRNDHPPFARIYWQVLIEAANGLMSSARSDPILDARYNGMTAGGAAGLANAQSLKDFIAGRRTFVLSQIAANNSVFAITSNGGADFTTNRNLITLTGTAPLEVRTLLVNGVPYPVTWTALNAWLIRIPLASGTNILAVTGRDPKGALVTGVSGTIRVRYTGANELPQDKIVINEIMYHPLFADASYVEVFNTSISNAFDMSGWKLNGAGFTFPTGSIIEPGAYKLIVEDAYIFAATYGPSAAVIGRFGGGLDNGGETLTLIKPGATPMEDVVIDQVTYDDDLPWPAAAGGGGASLQLIDALQDNNRSASWTAADPASPPPPVQWQYVVASGTLSRSVLYLYLQTAGDVYLDDIKLVAGSVPEIGANAVVNGDFESPLSGPWTIGSDGNNNASVISSSVKHSGNASLHLIASAGGTTQNSSIWQTFAPGLTTNAPFTLSFWFLPSTNGGPLILRLSGSGIVSTVNIAPSGYTNLARYTPGLANSVRAVLPPFPPLWLNEVLPNNFFLGTNGIADRFGERDPWVELYNGGTTNISLSGYSLANNYTNLAQWAFPASANIGPKQFLIVWLDGEPGESTVAEFHANFRAAPDLGSVVLSKGTNLESVIDHLNYSVPVAGRSYGSFPDGAVSGRRTMTVVTPNATNNPASAPLDVRINEWMADNATTLADPADGNYEDWLELYNPATNVVDLTGFFLSDTMTNTTHWAIPAGTTIPARGYLLVWADGETGQNSPARTDIHASFSLAKGGEAIALFAPDGTVIDAVTFGPQITDVSQGRFEDGAAPIYFMTNATPRAANFLFSPNTPPTLALIADKVVDEGSLLSFTCVATDTNVPAQTLAFSLDAGAPTGAGINAANGQFTWKPTEAQGPGVYPVTIRVMDNGSPSLSASQTVTITVNEVNNAPVLAPLLSRTINEGSLLLVTNSASDADSIPQTLTFSLEPGAPVGMTIDPDTGLIQWIPDEVQGPGTYTIGVRVTDDGDPPQSDSKTLTVFVVEVNTPPDLAILGNRMVMAGESVTFTALANDPDLPPQGLSFTLDPGAPPGASIDGTSGLFSWTPGSADAGTTNRIGVSVSDFGSPRLTAGRSFIVVVMEELLAGVSRSGESVFISVASVPGRTYRLEYKNVLDDPSWEPLGIDSLADGSTLTFTDGTTANGQRFYRVVLVQ
jgi:Lamin Tail Domain/CotH kinase protein/Putative Ig domain/PA14 domain/Carbohydrate binding domain